MVLLDFGNVSSCSLNKVYRRSLMHVGSIFRLNIGNMLYPLYCNCIPVWKLVIAFRELAEISNSDTQKKIIPFCSALIPYPAKHQSFCKQLINNKTLFCLKAEDVLCSVVISVCSFIKWCQGRSTHIPIMCKVLLLLCYIVMYFYMCALTLNSISGISDIYLCNKFECVVTEICTPLLTIKTSVKFEINVLFTAFQSLQSHI